MAEGFEVAVPDDDPRPWHIRRSGNGKHYIQEVDGRASDVMVIIGPRRYVNEVVALHNEAIGAGGAQADESKEA